MRFALWLLFFIILIYGIEQAAGATSSDIQDLIGSGNRVINLEPNTVYTITKPVNMKDNTVLRGGEGTVIRFRDNLRWKPFVPAIKAVSCHNITIENIEFQGGEQPEERGGGYYNFIQTVNCVNVVVRNNVFRDSLGDGLRATECADVEFYGNYAENLGHDVLYAIRSERVEAYNNIIYPRTNSALRLWNVNGARLHDNYIDADNGKLSSGPAIQIQHNKSEMLDIEVCNNVIKNSYGPGIWLVGHPPDFGKNEQVWIHHNLFTNSGYNGIDWQGGILTHGFDGVLIENNVFDGSYNGGYVVFLSKRFNAFRPGSQGFEATIRNNIFVDAKPRRFKPNSGTGYGIANFLPEAQTIINGGGNCFWNNAGEDLVNVPGSSTDLYIDPRKNPTPSGWTWNQDKRVWECERVQPSNLGETERRTWEPEDRTTNEDMEKFDSIFNILNAELSFNGLVSQGSIQAVSPDWEEGGRYTRAYIYLAGYDGLIYVNGEKYIPRPASECALVLTGTENTARNPSRQVSDLDLTDLPDGRLKAVLRVTTYYKVRVTKTISFMGQSINVKVWDTRKETVRFEKIFEPPEVFPVLSPEELDVTVKVFNNTYNPHTEIIVSTVNSSEEVITSVTYQAGNKKATEYRLIGVVNRLQNGVKVTSFESAKAFKTHDSGLTQVFQGCRADGVYNQSEINVTVRTPFHEYNPNFNYIVVEDPVRNGINKPLAVAFVWILIILRTLIIQLQDSGVGRWR